MKKNFKDRKVILSTLWIFVMFNYVYCDILGFMDSSLLKQYLTGTVEGLELTENFLFLGAILMEIPIAMILLSRVLNYNANRWSNIAAGSIKTLAMVMTMFVGTPSLYYLFFGTIEIATTIFIVYYAWTWKQNDLFEE
ncbi:DUF6326 family protein [Labilibacter marinus]|uniref:DUF6326 family protein n=1 Tax=Labilibacter marinus TaxID=1477105 RepID=UPI00094F700D|nr:DUF6326 family protein [Labilibacter marinus]